MTDHPARRVLTARVWSAMYDELEQAAKANHRSLSAEIAYRLERSVQEEKEKGTYTVTHVSGVNLAAKGNTR